MTTIPTCAKLTAAGTAVGDYLKSLHDWLAANPGNFTIANLVGGASPTSFTLEHTDGWQINYRISGGEILSTIDPDGEITDSATPDASANAQPEDAVVPSPTSTSTTMLVARYDDALLWMIKDNTNTFQRYAIHQGKILVPNRASDEALGLDGLGTLAYLPTEAPASTVGDWGCNNSANSKSYLRVATSTWQTPTYRSLSSVSDTCGITRFYAPSMFAGDSGSPSTSSDPELGSLKYVTGDGGTTLSPFAVVPSTSTNQGWLAIDDNNSTTRMRVLWDKTVTP